MRKYQQLANHIASYQIKFRKHTVFWRWTWMNWRAYLCAGIKVAASSQLFVVLFLIRNRMTMKSEWRKYFRSFFLKFMAFFAAFVILSCLIATAISQCPPSGCPPPVDPPNCGVPDCSIIQNTIHENALWPIQGEPTNFWQCAPGPQPGQWSAMRRACACGTVFNNNENPRRCTFWFERTWSVPFNCQWQVPPQLP